jgi:hypothetical protein
MANSTYGQNFPPGVGAWKEEVLREFFTKEIDRRNEAHAQERALHMRTRSTLKKNEK